MMVLKYRGGARPKTECKQTSPSDDRGMVEP